MQLIGLSVLIGVLWMFLTGRPTAESFILGFIIGITLLLLLNRSGGKGKHRPGLSRVTATLAYALQLLWRIFIADLLVARQILARNPKLQAGMVEVPVGSDKDWVAGMSAHAITVTPGSYAVAFERNDDGDITMLVHMVDTREHQTILDEQQGRIGTYARMAGDE